MKKIIRTYGRDIFAILNLMTIFNTLQTFSQKILIIFIHDISHWLGPAIILVFGSYILGRALYKSRHIHSDGCGHIYNKFDDTKVENPITVGILTGMLPCASSFAVVMMTGMTPTINEIIQFISIYVLGIALVLFIVVITFNYTKNIFIDNTTILFK